MQSIYSGDTYAVRRAWAAYPASAGWVAKARILARSTDSTLLLTGVADGDAHHLAATPVQTASLPAGTYSVTLWVERGADVYTVERFDLQVLPNLRSTSTATDTRSLAQRTLDDLKAAFASWSTSGGTVQRYKINEREMQFNSSAEIIKQIEYWQGQVDREAEAARIAAGGRPRNRIVTRFVRPR